MCWKCGSHVVELGAKIIVGNQRFYPPIPFPWPWYNIHVQYIFRERRPQEKAREQKDSETYSTIITWYIFSYGVSTTCLKKKRLCCVASYLTSRLVPLLAPRWYKNKAGYYKATHCAIVEQQYILGRVDVEEVLLNHVPQPFHSFR